MTSMYHTDQTILRNDGNLNRWYLFKKFIGLLEENPSKFFKGEENESHFISRFLLLPEIPALCLGPIMYTQ